MSGRKINFPKLDWSVKAEEYENAEPELSEEVYKVLKEDLDKLCLKADGKTQGAILACAVTDTIKLVEDGKIVKTVPRKNLFRAYTPQLCRLDLLKQSLNYAFENNLAITDDASALELSGFVVEIVEGSADNFKLTTREDLNMARLLIKE